MDAAGDACLPICGGCGGWRLARAHELRICDRHQDWPGLLDIGAELGASWAGTSSSGVSTAEKSWTVCL